VSHAAGGTDIVQRLRDSVRACRALDRSALLAEAADEIERLRLTSDEREAVTFFAEAGVYWSTFECVGHARRLFGLLKRLG